MIIQHNMAAVNTMMQLGITNTNLQKSTERLSSGYRINRAADDAAKLTISEKKRSQIRGLIRASQNAEDGIGFVKTGDGAMDQMAGILQRMREITVQSLNDVNTNQDRAALQMEFDQLQSEIDRMNDQTEFNELNVFEHYADTYFKFEGNRYWSQDQIHIIDDTNSSLDITYKISEDEPEKTITLTIPKGIYTTQELIDEMDNVVTALGEKADGLVLEYSDTGCCNMVLQGGEEIKKIEGGLSYLFFGEFKGSEVASLIGTTKFSPGFPLQVDSRNNELKFTIENFDGTSQEVNLTIATGNYTREEMIDYLNQALAGTGVKASEYGEYCIQVGGEDGVITGLKGNMFEIDPDQITSVFYDNTKYGDIEKTAAVFKGGSVLVTSSTDTEYNRFHIDDTNNKLRIKINTTEYADIELEQKEYTIDEMVSELQTKLTEKGLNAKVGKYTDTIRTVNSNPRSFSGITITSNEEGRESKIIFDKAGSTAYDTLFVRREYTDPANKITTAAGKYQYKAPVLTGGRAYDADDFPITLNDTNSSFRLTIKEDGISSASTFTIKLTEKSYTGLDEILTEINEQLNGSSASAGIKGKIEAVNKNGAISFQPINGNTAISEISFASTATAPYSVGYDTLFVGKNTVYSTTKISATGNPPSLTLDEVDDPTTIDSSNNKMTVTVKGSDRTITIPDGEYTPDELAEVITKKLEGTTTTYTNSYSGSGSGTTTDKTIGFTERSANATKTPFTCNVSGTGKNIEGQTAQKDTTPATYTIPVTLPSSTKISAENDEFVITLDGTDTYVAKLTHGSYTPAQLAEELDKQLKSAMSGRKNKVNVALNSSNRLVLTTQNEGTNAKMSFSPNNSTFLDSIRTTQASVTMQLSSALQNSIVLTDENNTFTGSLNGTSYSVKLTKGTYTRASFVAELNTQLQKSGVGVTASLNGSYLWLSAKGTNGNSVKVGFGTTECGAMSTAMFGELIVKTPAVAKLNRALQDTISMKAGENVFTTRLTQNGTTKDVSITIPAGDYTREELVSKMNELYNGEITVSMNTSGILTFTTAAKGKDVSIVINNNIGGSAGAAMFGEYSVTTPDVTATVNPDGKLVLTGESTGSSYTISVTPSANSPVLKPIPKIQKVSPTKTTRQLSAAYYTMKSTAAVPENLKIEDYNQNFQFTYNSPSGTRQVDFSLEEKTYTRVQLQEALQEKLDDAVGQNELVVTVNANGVQIRAAEYGSSYSITAPTGGFYEYVMKGTVVRSSEQETAYKAGTQGISDTYIIGRKDVNNTISKIKKDVNDQMSIDVTINNTVYTLELTLDPGEYNGEQLVKQLQKKLDEAVITKGLPERSILAGIGKFRSGVAGSNDDNALTIYLNNEVELPEGTYKIDGLKGSALFEVFYKTTGELIPAYITGTKNITEGVTIEPEMTDFSIDVDGVTYEYTIPEGDYTSEEMITLLNEIFDNPDNNGNTALINASLSGNSLKISHNKIGKHTVGNVQGSAKPELFYQTEGRKDYNSDLYLQVGANSNQSMDLKRYSMSTISMGINSVTISKRKYAEKALERLDGALDYLSTTRSNYGAKQNRLEYVVRGNDITSENLQASESRDRDVDMAKEVVQQSKLQILQQAGVAMLTQAHQLNASVLSLLQ